VFLLFGTRASEAVINVVTFICAYCGVHADHRVITRRNRLTLFFVPLFPVSTTHFTQCTNCGGTTRLTKAQAQHSLEWARTHKNAT
jgi:hypothetical protein